ncbi:hypothetical protein Syun_030757 [Stephania yunnanensis]|uniref:Uncharacterized protein n=1 Tax=Stephania yunnanensis TaxID=152371 RepID=A0AAP0DVF6_9MAGN
MSMNRFFGSHPSDVDSVLWSLRSISYISSIILMNSSVMGLSTSGTASAKLPSAFLTLKGSSRSSVLKDHVNYIFLCL